MSMKNWRMIWGDAVTFGPVPSRRLGQSLGINNIPPKICSYACVYCQLGRTLTMQTERTDFYDPHRIFEEVRKKVEEVTTAGEPVDYLSFVPDGEPTLDLNLGRTIDLLRPLGIKIAVITNSSLIWSADVRDELARADWVSLKVDSVREDVWRRIDRPHGKLSLSEILDGALAFSKSFSGRLVTETMLVEGINDSEELLEEIATYLVRLRPETAYLAIPTRPPAETNVRAPDEAGITRAWSVLSEALDNVELLTGYEGNTFFSGGRVDEDLLAITSVHPMRADAVETLLTRRDADRSVVQRLVEEGELIEVDFQGQSFLMRKLTRPRTNHGEG
jgi:wyosine [tRNA(Phe)-imidazoG37] synthetase (radical SAM superfamily)